MRIFRFALVSFTFAYLSVVVAAQSGDFPSRAAEELAQLKEGATLSEWMHAHAGDTLVLYSFRYRDWNGRWVVRATRRENLSDGRELVRYAYFYAPSPPADGRLPPSSNAEELRNQSQLGLIWVQSVEPDVHTGEKLAEQTRDGLSKRLMEGQFGTKLWYANAGYWTRTARWDIEHATFVSAYESTPEGTPHKQRVLAFGFLPLAGVHVDLGGGEDYYGEDFRVDMSLLEDAIAASGLKAKHLESMRFIKEKIEEYNSGQSQQWTNAVDQEVVVALKQWLLDSSRLRGVKRAAALLAADRALKMSQRLAHPENEAIRKQLETLGARFNYSPLGGAYGYTNSWLKQAIRYDRQGRIGQRAFVVLMENGFDTSGTCADTGYEGFRRVIIEGERFLKRTRNPELRNRTHLLMAKAYSDTVALADGAGEGYVDAGKYRNAARKAKMRAIAHYRRALVPVTNQISWVKTWRETWRLMAGVPPVNTSFFCIYD